jgi:3',5'-cyclic AMP phosphodiesterase CpdA
MIDSCVSSIAAVTALLWLSAACAAPAQGGPTEPDGPLLRIALVSDTHTNEHASDPDQGRYRGHLDKVIAQVNAAKPDVVLIAGDLTQGGRAEEVEDFLAQIKAFNAPVRYVPGNHDVGDKHLPSKPGAGVTSARVKRYERRLGDSWWAAEVGGTRKVRLIGVNSSLLGSGLPEESAQWTFLERELARPDSPPTLLLMHYPPFVKTPDESGGGYWNIEPAARERFLALIQKPEAHLIGVLTGHLHRTNDVRLGAIRIVTTPPVSFGIPQGKQPEGWTLVTVLPNGELRTEFHAIDGHPVPITP